MFLPISVTLFNRMLVKGEHRSKEHIHSGVDLFCSSFSTNSNKPFMYDLLEVITGVNIFAKYLAVL